MNNETDDLRNEIMAKHATREIDDVLERIINNDERQQPIIFEDKFIREVLPLLVHPFSEENLIRYKKYVVELTNPLRVASTTHPEILFVVPALYPRPNTTTTSDPNSVSVSHVVDHIARQRERSLENLEHYITEFLTMISGSSPIEMRVLKPLALILARYGRVLEDSEGNPLYSLDSNSKQTKGYETTSSFDNETPVYED